jgi:hypothetical protein
MPLRAHYKQEETLMETHEDLAESPYPGIELLWRCETDLVTALQSCENAVSCLAPAGGGLPHVPALAFAVGALMSAVGNLELAKVLLTQVHAAVVRDIPGLPVREMNPSKTTSEKGEPNEDVPKEKS